MAKKNKILFFTKYTSTGPSSRYRSYQYKELFERDFELEYYPLFDDDYIRMLYQNKAISKIKLLGYFIKRVFDILRILGTKNIVFIEYELLPYFPPLFERLLKLTGVKFILDYDDAIFHNYDIHPNSTIRSLLGKKISTIAKYAEYIITGSPYLTSYFKNFNKNVIEIPTSISIEKYDNLRKGKQGKDFIIGWIGSKTTSRNLLMITNALIKIRKKYPEVKIQFVGFDPSMATDFKSIGIELIEWNSSIEMDFLNEINIGIMPLEDTLFNKGKCGFKLIQYMAMGKPTISSPLEANIKINGEGNNLFASDETEWYNSLCKIIDDNTYFYNSGMENVEIVRKHYSIESNSDKYINLFNQIFHVRY